MPVSDGPAPSRQVYRIYIKADPTAVWAAITSPEFSYRYGYSGLVSYDLQPGGGFEVRADQAMKDAAADAGFPMPDVMVDGEVIECDPPRKLVQTWRMAMDSSAAEEGFTRLTWELAETQPGLTRLTVLHELDGAPLVAAMVAGRSEDQGAGGGWSWVLSDMKTLLETGSNLAGPAA